MIAFAAPWALMGLVAAGIPLLLHLLARREPPTVVFPATRYLAETARARHRRLTLQHWLLLLVRTVLIAALVVAAAGPTVPSRGVGTHPPSALVLLLDNSLSSAATVDGTPVLERLTEAARAVLRAARSDDALWLLTSDQAIRAGTAMDLEALVSRVAPEPRRLDLGPAIGLARATLAGQSLPGTVVLFSDLQATAVTAAPDRLAGESGREAPLVVVRPEQGPVPNLGLSGIGAGRQPWGPEGGRLTVTVAGDTGRNAALSVRVGNRAPRQQLVGARSAVSVSSGPLPPGWWPIRAELEPDELRLDDVRESVARVAPPARAAWREEDRFLAVACEVLRENGRLVRGTDLTIGWLGSGTSIVQPPADAAALGALNRALGARGTGWRYGDPVAGAGSTDSGSVLGRHRVSRRHSLLAPPGSAGDVLVTAAGDPWAVRSGGLVLLGSRLDPVWTELPLSAEFVPFVDFLANRAVRGELVLLEASPGDPVFLPSGVTAVAGAGGRRPVEGGAAFRPGVRGVLFLLEGRDTVGALAVNPDPRESALARSSDAEVRRLWPGARLVNPDQAAAEAFSTGGRADLRGSFLLLAALLALTDASLAGWRMGTRRDRPTARPTDRPSS